MMDDAEQSPLLLNISNVSASAHRLKKRVSGTRIERIKARKKLKRSASHDVPENNLRTSETFKEKTKKTQGQKRKLPQENVENEKSPVKKTKNPSSSTSSVISSLFKKNPEIPQVASKNVDTLTEDLFASTTFQDFSSKANECLHSHMVSNLEQRLKLTQMTTVQKLGIPHIISRRDTLIKSQTGSGKTLTFAIPIVQALQNYTPHIQRSDGIHALVIVPTRELAKQCFETFQKLVYPFQWVVPGCIMGGEKRKAEKARLRKGINILVCTPGRLLDHIEHTHNLLLARVQYLVLDEADRLLELGYERDVAKIINALNSSISKCTSRQNILLSATLSDGVQRLAGMSLKDPVTVNLTDQSYDLKNKPQVNSTGISGLTNTETVNEPSYSVPENLEQNFVITPCKLRLVTLASFVISKYKEKQKGTKMLVFLPTQDVVEFHYAVFCHFFNGGSANKEDKFEGEEDIPEAFRSVREVNALQLQFFKLHGEMPQSERISMYEKFCQSQSGVLFCTDVACRGLDMPHVKWIIQHSAPGGATDYIHRIGRTARAGQKGNSLLFLLPSEVDYVSYLNESKIQLTETKMFDILEKLLFIVPDLPKIKIHRHPPKTSEEAATFLQQMFEECVMENSPIKEKAVNAFTSYIRSYAAYPSSLKKTFCLKQLHLGHLAKSFGLREAPTHLPTGLSSEMKKQRKKKEEKKRLRQQQLFRTMQASKGSCSEFSSGFDGKSNPKKSKSLKKKKKKHKP